MDTDRTPPSGAPDGWAPSRPSPSQDDTPATGVLLTAADGALVEPADAGTDPVSDTPAPVTGWRRLPRPVRSIVEWGLVIGVALLVALGVRTWVFQPFWIPSGSMENTLEVGDRVLVNKLSYRLHDFNRGDVIVFEQPESWLLDDDIKDLIKRIIGLPGDEIRIADCSVYVDGQRLIESYTDGQCTDPASSVVDPDGDGSFVVPEDMLFVMGDNRTGSQDSRVHGFVPEGSVVGRAFVVIWPQGHWKWL